MITISTFNIQNDIKKYSIEKEKLILKYLKDNKIDILNLQEVYSSLYKDLEKDLELINYKSFGNYRYHLRKIFNRINEKTPIITKYKVINYKNYYLPYLPSLLKRIMTKVEIEVDNKVISIYNTHLDYKFDTTKKRQLKRILKIISRDTNPIILTGDFNLKNNNKIFIEFINELEKINIKHIDVLDNTWKPSKAHRAIDHIFISKDFKIKSTKIIRDIPTSDHYPIIMKVEL